MITFASKDAKNKFGEMIDAAQREPVVISKKGRSVAVVISKQEYERLQALEDVLWAKKADEAMKNAEWLGPDESEKFLKGLLSAEA
ncbi:MAG: type II toxin-antitoxin system Phd/YefM family antitoxin [Chloroflexi bacterium]|nr:type II toxin-antitoxin system Phd/YefM family antitoxin [Chloroflexota bacterium]